MLKFIILCLGLSLVSLPLCAQAKEESQETHKQTLSETSGNNFAKIGIVREEVLPLAESVVSQTPIGMEQTSTLEVPADPSWMKEPNAPISSKSAETSQKSAATTNGNDNFHWGGALKQSLVFLGIQHGFAMTQEKTRRELKGPFIKDYFRSVSKLSGWDDGGRFFTNYISHPMEGSVAGFIQIQNDPKGIRQEFGKSRDYWMSRLKAMAFNAAYSTQFELGPISQSSIGNVGLHTTLDGKKRKMAYVDLVVTPTLGTAWLIGEDVLERYVMRRLEAKNIGKFRLNTLRMFLNPMRGTANLLRFKAPWYRD